LKNHFPYQDQNSQLTLREGLANYYQVHPRIQRPDWLDAAGAELFKAHDICHVIFGLDTTLVDEALADLRTMLGTNVGVANYVQYLRKNPDAKKIFRELGYFRVVLATMAVVPRFLKALWLHRKKRRLWPWHNPPEIFGKKLAELRKEYEITVI
jgi:hypothetical protein